MSLLSQLDCRRSHAKVYSFPARQSQRVAPWSNSALPYGLSILKSKPYFHFLLSPWPEKVLVFLWALFSVSHFPRLAKASQVRRPPRLPAFSRQQVDRISNPRPPHPPDFRREPVPGLKMARVSLRISKEFAKATEPRRPGKGSKSVSEALLSLFDRTSPKLVRLKRIIIFQ